MSKFKEVSRLSGGIFSGLKRISPELSKSVKEGVQNLKLGVGSYVNPEEIKDFNEAKTFSDLKYGIQKGVESYVNVDAVEPPSTSVEKAGATEVKDTTTEITKEGR